MAHIANHDVRRTYFTQALWSAIVVVFVLFGFALGGLLIRDYFLGPLRNGMSSVDWGRMLTVRLPAILIIILQVGVTFVVSATIRASVLRIRENYADWRTVIWGAGKSLFIILRNEAAKNKDHRKNLLRFHPSAKQRMSVLGDSRTLFRMPLDLSFQVGFLLGITISNGVTYLGILSSSFSLAIFSFVPTLIDLAEEKANLPLAILAYVIAQYSKIVLPALFSIPFIIIVGYLASGLSLQTQREAVAGMIGSDSNVGGYFRLWAVAAMSALGLETGFLFGPFSPLWPSGANNIYLVLMLFIGIIVTTWLCLTYARFFGKRVLGSHIQKSPPVWKRRLLTLCYTLILGGFYLPLMVERIFFVNSSDPLNQQYFRNFIINGLIVALILYMIVFGTTWMLFQIKRFTRTPRCPHCNTGTHQEYSVGKTCKNCGQALAPWLMIE